jgi:hypothetical protein
MNDMLLAAAAKITDNVVHMYGETNRGKCLGVSVDHSQKVEMQLVGGTHGACPNTNLSLNCAAGCMLNNESAIPPVAAKGQPEPAQRVAELVGGRDEEVPPHVLEGLLNVPEDCGLVLTCGMKTSP